MTQCGKTGVATANSSTIRDTFRVGPTARQSATGLARILITQKGDKRIQFVQENELYRFCACFCFDGTLWQRLRMLHSDGTLCSAVAQGQTLYAPEHDANVIERKDGVRPSSEQVLCKQLQLFVCHLLFLHCPWTAVLLQFQRDRIF